MVSNLALPRRRTAAGYKKRTDSFRLRGEFPADGNGSRHVRSIAIPLGAGIDADQLASLQRLVVLPVMQRSGVGARASNHGIGLVLGAMGL